MKKKRIPTEMGMSFNNPNELVQLDSSGKLPAVDGSQLTGLTSFVTYEALNSNGDVGTSTGQLAAGNHNHTGTYEPVLNADQKRKVTISSSAPSGGSDGDVWLQYTP